MKSITLAMAFAAAGMFAVVASAQTMSAAQIVKNLTTPAEEEDDIAARAARPDPVTRLCEPRPAALAPSDSAFRNLVVEAAPTVNLTVEFDFGKATLRPEGALQLDALATALRNEALARKAFAVGGHTDSVGSRDVNERLSCDRALAAKAYLVQKHGVPPDRLVAMGFGSLRPIVPENPAAAANRRVEIKVLEK